METIKLHNIEMHNIEGSGTDSDGNHWIEFEVDYFAEQDSGTCSICGEELEYGWMCLDGGEEVCDDHISF